MEYKLAKELKNARFPQQEFTEVSFDRKYNEQKFLLRENCDSRDGQYNEMNDRTMWIQYFAPKYVEEMLEFVVYIPTLSELIEACGDGLYSIIKRSNGEGDNWEVRGEHKRFSATTLKEAVSRLWLALNERHGKIT